MGVSILDEDSFSYETVFVAFDDSNKSKINAASNVTINTTGSNPGIDTREIDIYRQGIEISSNAYRFAGTTAKIWAGNIKGYTKIQTLGQSVSFTDFEQTKIFEETLLYEPVAFITSDEEVYFSNTIDDIPIDNKEAVLQPFTIKGRNGTNKGDDPRGIHDVRGNLEDGNESHYSINPDNSIVEQFIVFGDTKDNAFFNDCDYVSSITDSTEDKINRFEIATTIIPFSDNSLNTISKKINTNNSDFVILLNSTNMDINLDKDIREKYGRVSATAGFSVYSSNGSEIGTDSIAFNGLFKGN